MVRTKAASGAVPSRGLPVSIISLTPDTTMNTATARPKKPSRFTLVKRVIRAPSSTTVVAMASLRLSLEVANTVSEWMALPTLR